ncbi:MAG: flagellar biosynthetic protein FliO [Clostridiales bacterium]|nr:flagellar biosynthetic protein FliO [Clostridiales bacterium]
MYFTLLSQSPVGTQDSSGIWPTNLMLLGQFFFYVVIFGVVLALAYFSAKWLARARFARGRAANMQIIESVSAGFQNMLLIARVGERYFLLGSSKDRLVFLSELNPEDLGDSPGVMNPIPLKEYLQKLIKPKLKE